MGTGDGGLLLPLPKSAEGRAQGETVGHTVTVGGSQSCMGTDRASVGRTAPSGSPLIPRFLEVSPGASSWAFLPTQDEAVLLEPHEEAPSGCGHSGLQAGHTDGPGPDVRGSPGLFQESLKAHFVRS